VEGLYVPPGDAPALRSAIDRLIANPEEAARMGRAGRALVERNHTLDGYVARLAGIIWATGRQSVLGTAPPTDPSP
jgi:glycosyltransferase involved in cell wall biosynthesis